MAAPADVIAAELDALADAGDLRGQMSTLRVPLLLRVGEEDAATPPTISREIADAATDARLELVPGCGHALLIEDSEATIASVCAFMRK